MDEAEYCDRLGLIYRGELIACGTPEHLKQQSRQDSLEQVFVSLVEARDRAERPQEEVRE
jgi:ABC-2 type transport system ATP-binding protein